MIKITLPDKSKRNFDEPPTIFELAQDIGPGLAKATLAGVINGEEHDACDLIEKNSEVTYKTKEVGMLKKITILPKVIDKNLS